MRTNLLWLFLLVVPMAFTMTSCDDDDDDVSLMDALRADDQFSTLVTAIETAGLDAQINLTPGTLFAPTNDAFAGIDIGSIPDDELDRILLYHLVAGPTIESGDIGSGQTYVGSALAGPDNTRSGVSILVEGGSGVTLNGDFDVVEADIRTDNGVIHAIDGVMMPLDIVGQASANSNFSTLVSVLPPDIVETLQGDGPFTVFAPINSAFDDISDIVAGLTPEQLEAVLTYHVVGGAQVFSDQLSDGQNVTTVNGDQFTVNINGDNVTISDTQGGTANVIITDVQATNGVIHALDAVIIPNL